MLRIFVSMKKIVLAGGGGNLGRALTRSFLALGYHVVVLSRQDKPSQREDVQFVKWDAVQLGDWVNSLEGADVLINLCGEGIAKRLTDSNKKILRDSRIIPTLLLGQALQQVKVPPSLWVNFSGISIFEGLEWFHDERSGAIGTTFLAKLSQEWEEAFASCDVATTRKTVVRVSPVLTSDSGMFAELHPLVRYGLGGKVGDGRQYISWIHEQDFIRMIHWVMDAENPASIYHACSPKPEANVYFMCKFREAVGVSFGLPLPAFMAKVGAWVKGVDSGLLLGNVAATSTVATDEGFKFVFPEVEKALENLLHSKKK